MKQARRNQGVLAADAVIGTALRPVRAPPVSAVGGPARRSIRDIKLGYS